MFEVVTAVAWEEWEGIVMVTMVLVGAWVWDTEPKEKEKSHARSFCRALSHQCIYIQIKRAKTPTQTTAPRRSAISLLQPTHALPNAVFTINKEFLKGNQVPSSRRKNNQKPNKPHASPTWALWTLTSCGCWRNRVRCQNRCHCCCCHWSTSTENGFLWKEKKTFKSKD